ncbi:class I SAM-dependent methyltransferase [Parasphingopyxis algicola]|nr:class I SAM-dependent methyltransferase [Parasphingopyxis algicola]
MNAANPIDNTPTAVWNGAAGEAWVDAQALMDGMFAPIEALLVETVSADPARNVLDVGCGTGGTTLAMARAIGAQGRCTGIDISEPMIAAARARADTEAVPADFICADAQTHPFEPGRFDRVVSRFGVMFFDDFTRAFANLRRAATDDARMRLIAWRSPEENPFMTAAERAAAPLLPDLPPRNPDEPGQFAFADRDRPHRFLKEAGWTGIDITPIDFRCTFPEPALERYLARLGPVGRVLAGTDEATRAKVVAAVRPAFDPYVAESEVRFTAACWMIDARAPAA